MTRTGLLRARRAALLVAALVISAAPGCDAGASEGPSDSTTPSPVVPPTAEPTRAAPALPGTVCTSQGGGAVGAFTSRCVTADGALRVEFGDAGPRSDPVPGGTLDGAAKDRIASLLAKTKLGALGCVPSNMTDSISVQTAAGEESACAAMGGGSPEFRALYDEVASILGSATRDVKRPPPPLPPLPQDAWLELVRGKEVIRLTRTTSKLPAAQKKGARAVDDATLLPAWHALFHEKFYSGASIEETDGKRLPGAPYPCATMSIRVGSGNGETFQIRARCSEGEPEMERLAQAIRDAAKR